MNENDIYAYSKNMHRTREENEVNVNHGAEWTEEGTDPIRPFKSASHDAGDTAADEARMDYEASVPLFDKGAL